jgi:hypothetical protein
MAEEDRVLEEERLASEDADTDLLPASSVAVSGDSTSTNPLPASTVTVGVASMNMDPLLTSSVTDGIASMDTTAGNRGPDEAKNNSTEPGSSDMFADNRSSSSSAKNSTVDGKDLPLKTKDGVATDGVIAGRRIAPLKKKKKAVKSTPKDLITTIPPSSNASFMGDTPSRMTRSMTAAMNASSASSPTVLSVRIDDLSDTARQAIISTERKVSMPVLVDDLSDTAKWAIMSADHKVLSGAQATEELDPEGDFWRFPNLPAECQLMIWEEAVSPRIIKLKAEKIPGIAHACHDSRKVAQYIFRKSHNKTGIFLNPKCDILLLDSQSFSGEVDYHQNAMHTLSCSKINKSLLKSVERVALTLDEVTRIWGSGCFHCHLICTLPKYLRNIKE